MIDGAKVVNKFDSTNFSNGFMTSFYPFCITTQSLIISNMLL